MKTIFRSIFALALAASATVVTIGVAAPVLASEARVAKIGTAGIDLTTPAGRAQVDARVRQAARSVCRVDDFEQHKHRAEVRACTNRAIAAASQQIAALVTAQQLADATPRTQTAQ